MINVHLFVRSLQRRTDTFLGSDCHDFRNRRPNMKKAAEVVLKKNAQQILETNPRNMLRKSI